MSTSVCSALAGCTRSGSAIVLSPPQGEAGAPGPKVQTRCPWRHLGRMEMGSWVRGGLGHGQGSRCPLWEPPWGGIPLVRPGFPPSSGCCGMRPGVWIQAPGENLSDKAWSGGGLHGEGPGCWGLGCCWGPVGSHEEAGPGRPLLSCTGWAGAHRKLPGKSRGWSPGEVPASGPGLRWANPAGQKGGPG